MADYGIRPAGYRLPEASHLGAVHLQVADLARSLEYYEKVLGLRVLGSRPGSATLGAQGAPAALIELIERPGARPVPRHGRLGLYHFAILLPDRPALGRFLSHLASVGEHAGMSDHLVSEALYLSDPDGLGIEVYADRPRKTWQHEAGQLVMRTDPLDVAAVMGAAGAEPWTGMPAGTVMGHVHLFVSDLPRAESFYHFGLGLDKMVWSYPGALFLAAGGYHHHLGTNTWAARAPMATEEDARLLEWTVRLPGADDVEGAAKSIEAAGYQVAGDRGNRTALDPWGTRIRLAS